MRRLHVEAIRRVWSETTCLSWMAWKTCKLLMHATDAIRRRPIPFYPDGIVDDQDGSSASGFPTFTQGDFMSNRTGPSFLGHPIRSDGSGELGRQADEVG